MSICLRNLNWPFLFDIEYLLEVKFSILLLKQQVVITHIFRQTEIPTLLDSWFTNTPAINMSCPQKTVYAYIFIKHNMLKCLCIEDRSSFFPVSCKIVCQLLVTDCCLMTDMLLPHWYNLSRYHNV